MDLYTNTYCFDPAFLPPKFYCYATRTSFSLGSTCGNIGFEIRLWQFGFCGSWFTTTYYECVLLKLVEDEHMLTFLDSSSMNESAEELFNWRAILNLGPEITIPFRTHLIHAWFSSSKISLWCIWFFPPLNLKCMMGFLGGICSQKGQQNKERTNEKKERVTTPHGQTSTCMGKRGLCSKSYPRRGSMLVRIMNFD